MFPSSAKSQLNKARAEFSFFPFQFLGQKNTTANHAFLFENFEKCPLPWSEGVKIPRVCRKSIGGEGRTGFENIG